MSDFNARGFPRPHLPPFPSAPPIASNGEDEVPDGAGDGASRDVRRFVIGGAVIVAILMLAVGVRVTTSLQGDLDDERKTVEALEGDKARLSEELAGTETDLADTEAELADTEDELTLTANSRDAATATRDTCRDALEKANEMLALGAEALGYAGIGITGDLYSLTYATIGLEDVSARMSVVSAELATLQDQCGAGAI